MVRAFSRRFALALIICLAGCSKSIDNPEAVRQAVIGYLSKRSNLNISGMNVAVARVSFRSNEADAVVEFTARGSNPGKPMTIPYTLERQGNKWVVKQKAEGGANPHGGAMPATGDSGQLPPGHPPTGAQARP